MTAEESEDCLVIHGTNGSFSPARDQLESFPEIRLVASLADQTEFITVQAAADRLAVSRWMIYRLIWDQQVKSVQIGRCRRIVRKSFDNYIAGLIDGAA